MRGTPLPPQETDNLIDSFAAIVSKDDLCTQLTYCGTVFRAQRSVRNEEEEEEKVC